MRAITRDEWESKLRHGYASVGADSVKRVLALDRETGATVLEPVRVEAAGG